MKNRFLTGLVLLLSGCSYTINEKINHVIEGENFNGVVMVYQNDTPLYEKAYGLKDIEKQTPLNLDDQFIVASLSKKVAAVTVAHSQKNLHTSLKKIKSAEKRNITFHELLSHTSGISDGPVAYPATQGQYTYSNQGYNLAAKILEEKTKKSFDSLLQKTIQTAGMKNSTFQPSKAEMDYNQLTQIAPRLVKSYDKDKNQEFTQKAPRVLVTNAPGGLISTAKDLILFDKALYEKKVWGEDKKTLFTKPYTDFDHYRWGKMGYSYGSQISKTKPLEYSHSGMGRGGLFTLLYYPETKTHVVILENIFWKDQKGWANFEKHDAIRKIVQEELSK